MEKGNAKEIPLAWGIKAAAADRMGVSRQYFGQIWKNPKAGRYSEAVQTVLQIVEEWKEEERRTQAAVEKLKTTLAI
jgi:cytochrome c556